MSYDVFSGFYDRLTDNVEYEKRADYFCRLLSLCDIQGGILLDLGCGTGSMSVKMAEKGFDVIGVDSSVGMLGVAQQKAYETGRQILLLNQPMQDIDLYGTVDCAICVLDGINHLNDSDEVRQTFEKVSLFMNKGGAFAFDVNTIYKHRNVLADNAFIYDFDDLFCAWQNNYNSADNSVDIMLDFFEEEDGVYYRSSENFSEQAYELNDISLWLSDAGFDIIGIYDDLTTDPVKPDSERAVFLAKKK
ncbi:MAG: class I SAM-dependent methyltransferase [Clostridia bacterium]|nr:class I SAM-dependent methyltransferase [Clostridia bacterium]MBQ7122468.1 class I SAM-dependent methyltransferase [Clostridia bacterium]